MGVARLDKIFVAVEGAVQESFIFVNGLTQRNEVVRDGRIPTQRAVSVQKSVSYTP